MFETDLISRQFGRIAREHQVPGAQLAIRHHGKTLNWEFGETEIGSALTVHHGTAIPIGSVTKAFTATLAIALVADGDLDLDAPVVEYDRELRRLPRGLTLRHLLSHTGGLTSDFEPDDGTSPRRHVQDCCELAPVVPPGTCFSYSNVGYVIVARLVELVTGMSWAEAAEVMLLRPLGIMPAFVGRDDTPRQIAAGHTVNRATGAIRPVEQSLAAAEAATGALAMSALDLLAFGRMHLPDDGGGIIAADALAMMHKPQPGADPFGLAAGWGLGLAVYSGAWLGHDGMGDGTSCHLRIQPDSGTVVALTTNSSSGYQMWKQLIGELRSAGLAVGDHEPLSGSLRPVPPPAACAGRYRNGDTEYSIAIADGDGLRLTIDGEHSARLIPYEGMAFSINDPGTGEFVQAGRFLPDDVQRVHGIQITGRTAARVEV